MVVLASTTSWGEEVSSLPTANGLAVSAAAPVVEARYEVKSSHTAALNDGTGRKVTMQRIKPLVLPPPPVVAAPVPVDPAFLAARRAAWARDAKKERCLLSLSGTSYPNGQTFLRWYMPGPDGKWTTYEAWTLTDFRAAWLVPEFEVGNTLYDVFPTIHPASQRDLRRDFPGPLWFTEGSPSYRLTKGDPSHTRSLEPITALHQILRQEGPALTAQALALRAAAVAENARLKANPPPVEDVVIRITLLKSNRYPAAEGEVNAAKVAGARLAKPQR